LPGQWWIDDIHDLASRIRADQGSRAVCRDDRAHDHGARPRPVVQRAHLDPVDGRGRNASVRLDRHRLRSRPGVVTDPAGDEQATAGSDNRLGRETVDDHRPAGS
jgi:hypothetical protein